MIFWYRIFVFVGSFGFIFYLFLLGHFEMEAKQVPSLAPKRLSPKIRGISREQKNP